jgi:hypothetical protein
MSLRANGGVELPVLDPRGTEEGRAAFRKWRARLHSTPRPNGDVGASPEDLFVAGYRACLLELQPLPLDEQRAANREDLGILLDLLKNVNLLDHTPPGLLAAADALNRLCASMGRR